MIASCAKSETWTDSMKERKHNVLKKLLSIWNQSETGKDNRSKTEASQSEDIHICQRCRVKEMANLKHEGSCTWAVSCLKFLSSRNDPPHMEKVFKILTSNERLYVLTALTSQHEADILEQCLKYALKSTKHQLKGDSLISTLLDTCEGNPSVEVLRKLHLGPILNYPTTVVGDTTSVRFVNILERVGYRRGIGMRKTRAEEAMLYLIDQGLHLGTVNVKRNNKPSKVHVGCVLLASAVSNRCWKVVDRLLDKKIGRQYWRCSWDNSTQTHACCSCEHLPTSGIETIVPSLLHVTCPETLLYAFLSDAIIEERNGSLKPKDCDKDPDSEFICSPLQFVFDRCLQTPKRFTLNQMFTLANIYACCNWKYNTFIPYQDRIAYNTYSHDTESTRKMQTVLRYAWQARRKVTTMLNVICQNGDRETLGQITRDNALLQLGLKDEVDIGAIACAAWEGHLDIVKVILKSGVPVCTVDLLACCGHGNHNVFSIEVDDDELKPVDQRRMLPSGQEFSYQLSSLDIFYCQLYMYRVKVLA